MSWQFNHLIGQQTAAIGTPPLSSSPTTSPIGTKNGQLSASSSSSKTPTMATTSTTAATNTTPSSANYSMAASDYKNATDTRMTTSGHHHHHQQANAGPASSSFYAGHSRAPELVDDHEFFQKFLQQEHRLRGSESHHHQHHHNLQQQQQQQLLHQNLSAGSDNTILGTPITPVAPSTFDYLLSNQHQQQASLPWSTYSMPIYSSFGQANVCANQRQTSNNILMSDPKLTTTTTMATSTTNNINNNNNNNTANIIDRFNNQRDNSANVFSQSRSNFQQNELMGRSYSSVLNAATGSETSQQAGRLGSMFANSTSQQQHQHQMNNNQDLNNNEDTLNLQHHASLLPTNNKQSAYSQHQQRHVSGLFNQHTNYQQHHYGFQQASQTNGGSGAHDVSVASSMGYLGQSRQQQQQAINNSSQHQQATGSSIGSHSKRLNNSSRSNKFPSSIFNNNNNSSAATNQSLITSGDNQQHSGVYGTQQNIIVNYANSNSNLMNNSERHSSHDIQAGNESFKNSLDTEIDRQNNDDGTDEDGERFSRKVFVGGLPPDIDEEEIKASFRRFGNLIVDWPHKAESKSYFPPKGYAFLLFHEESSVQALIDSCLLEDEKLYLCVSSPTIKDKPVQIRPWRLSDADFVLDSTLALDPRKTVFVGGVPRPLKASELANIMNNLYGGVCYAGIDTDPELKYPKGAGRVAFSNHQSYISAISARFVHLQHSEFEKRVEVKPYVLDDQFCDECQGARCNNKFAPFFCANIACLQYYCENCWSIIHSQAGKEYHKPLVKEGADRPRGVPSSRWN